MSPVENYASGDLRSMVAERAHLKKKRKINKKWNKNKNMLDETAHMESFVDN